MSDHPANLNGVVNPLVSYEHSDLSFRSVAVFAAVLVVVLGVVSLGLWYMIPAYLGPTRPPQAVESWKFRGEPGPNSDDSHLPAKPELEFIDRNAAAAAGNASTRRIQDQIAEEQTHLSRYGRGPDGTAFIPIKEAMERLSAQADSDRPAQGRTP